MNPSGTDTSQLSDRPEREKDTFLTARIFFSLDRCLLMGNPAAEQRGIISNGVNAAATLYTLCAMRTQTVLISCRIKAR